MKRTNDVVVGLVVLFGVLALGAALVWVNQLDVGRRRQEVVARFRNVGSAQVGNTVVIRGVPTGRVQSVELAEGGWVRMRLSLDPAVELPRDPAVLLGASSLFGEWQATVMERTALPRAPGLEQQVAEAAEAGPELPGAILPDIAQLTAVAGGIAEDVAAVAERVHVAFNYSAAR